LDQVAILFVGSTENFEKAKRTTFEMIKVESKNIMIYARIFLHMYPNSKFSTLFREIVSPEGGGYFYLLIYFVFNFFFFNIMY
jgi:hypothetical protein